MGMLLNIFVDRPWLWFTRIQIGNLVKLAMKTMKTTLDDHGRKSTKTVP